MNNKLKTLGLAMAAVLAMSAVVASAAPAQFTASGYPTTVVAASESGNGFFKTEAGNVECSALFQGQLTKASTTLTVLAAYENCEALGLGFATVNMNGCHYVLHSDGVVDLVCPGGKAVVIVAGPCEVQVPAQTDLKSIALESNSPHIDALATVRGISYTVTKDQILCPFNGTGAKTGGEYIQNSDVTIESTSGTTLSFDPPPEAQFTASSYPTTVTGTSALGNGFFQTEAGKVECAAHFEGLFSEASTTSTITPSYTSCKAFGAGGATVKMNGCNYVFHGNGIVDLTCPGGSVVTIAIATCEAQVKAQSGLKIVSLENSGSHISAQATVRGIKYNVTADGFLCPFNGTGEKSGGEYVHNSAVTLKPVSGGTSISLD